MRKVDLMDKYTVNHDRVFISGVQALVKIPLLQKEIDVRNGLNTGGFISGYRGSPISTYDMELWKAEDLLVKNDILFQPGVNEDLAATAVWGTQMIGEFDNPKHEGIFAIWYGKGPGVDRSGDPFSHGNVAGTHEKGGVLIVAGDDHVGKSSTVAHQSEFALIHSHIPIFAPSNVDDVIQLGLMGFAMSRYTGLYTGFKLCNETLEQTMTVDISTDEFSPVLPDRGPKPVNGFHNHPTHIDRKTSDIVVKRYRWPLIYKFLKANNINKTVISAKKKKFGIVTSGKAYMDVRQALKLLGLSEQDASKAGISVYKLGCTFPVEPSGLKDFAKGHEELFFVEEKNPITEDQAKSILYGSGITPRVIGKVDENGNFLLPSDDQLVPAEIAIIIENRLEMLGASNAKIKKAVNSLQATLKTTDKRNAIDAVRSPYFCSGCPHNTSTRFPDGSKAAGGIGCHAMAMYSGPEMLPNAQMGGEGGHWFSLAHFTDDKHIFQNMGDGTYYHSGLLSVRGAVAAKVNMTFKILYNDAVAMTGGQPIDGPVSVGDISKQVLAEGVKKCVVVTDRPDLYSKSSGLAENVEAVHRDRLDSVQKELRDIEGVTVIIYEQTCAAEKRRRRKRGKFPDPAKRVYINSSVCEGCGDCNEKSNCVSVWPKETELGRKRQIDQSNCNKDYSCLKGFCPSFVTVLDAEPRKPEKAELTITDEEIPLPDVMKLGEDSYNIMISGIGGTGVVTIGALLGMAAHIEDKACSIFDMTGLSQKNGSVYSHLRIANKNKDLGAQKLGACEANLILAFDAIAASDEEPFLTINPDNSNTLVNARITPTPAFQRNNALTVDETLVLKRLEKASAQLKSVDATGLGLALLGNSIAANLFMLGYAYQLGLLPFSGEAIIRAVEINGVAIDFNKKAFRFGRMYAVDPERIEKAAEKTKPKLEFKPLTDLDDIIKHRTELLKNYQNEKWSKKYLDVVQKVRAQEDKIGTGRKTFSTSVAKNLSKLMSYKDEYEVGRLHSDPKFKQELQNAFEDGAKLKYNLAPPLFSKKDPETGHLLKREFGTWVEPVFALLSKAKFLRGTAFDIFGYTQERKMERGLIKNYIEHITKISENLTSRNYPAAVEYANLPEMIKGYGHVKEANVEKAKKEEKMILSTFDTLSKTNPNSAKSVA